VGYIAAALAVLIFAAYPVATRAGVAHAFRPDDLVLLRFGIAALLLSPVLALRSRTLSFGVWRDSAALSLYQGAGMAALVVCGLQYAPASHAAALGPGVVPAWTALFGYLLFSRRPPFVRLLGIGMILAGTACLLSVGATGRDTLLGDVLFLAASALGAMYFLRLRDCGMDTFLAAALVSLYSALAMLAWYALNRAMPFAGVDAAALLWQALWQGLLIGVLALVALNHAIAKLGGQRTSVLLALVPVAGMLLGGIFLAEIPQAGEWLGAVAISLGVAVCSLQAGNPASKRALAKISA
jgi:drug/metabolite transporter (DMT)-like permease